MTFADIQPALTQLYLTFQAPTPKAINGCPCCIDQKDVCTLTTKPLHDLTDDELAPYAVSAFLTVDGDDFRYFLPRIFELSATVGGWWPSPEVTIGKLRRANWRSWSEAERATVRSFLAAWFEHYLSLGSEYVDEIDSILCGIALSGENLTPYLTQLSRHSDALQAYRAINAESLGSRQRLVNEFWEEAPGVARPIVEFLTEGA